MMIAMCVPNVIVLYVLAPEVKKDLRLYCRKYNLGRFIYSKWFKDEPAKVEVKSEVEEIPEFVEVNVEDNK